MSAIRFQIHTRSYLSLRKTVGWIGILLPFVLSLGVMLGPGNEEIISSISHYYYTMMGDVFVGSLCAVALFMFFYCGYSKEDDWTGNIAAVSAIGVALFPTTEGFPTEAIGKVHFAFATLFFLALAYYSLFLFTKTKPDEAPTDEKLMRNKIYIFCGIVMLVCLGAITIYAILVENTTETRFIFWAESIALVVFGISWMTKGETMYLFPDKE